MPFSPAASPHGPVTSARTFLLRAAADLAAVAIAVAVTACGSSRASTGQSVVEKPDLTVAAVPAPWAISWRHIPPAQLDAARADAFTVLDDLRGPGGTLTGTLTFACTTARKPGSSAPLTDPQP